MLLNGISSRQSLGVGGVRYAYIAKMSDLDITFTEGTGGEAGSASTAAFALADGTVIDPGTSGNSPFKKYVFTVETSSSDAAQTGTPAQGSSVFAHTVNMTFHKKNAALRNEVQALAEDEVVVVMVDCNGYAELLGGQCGEGLHMTAGTTPSGVARGDLNGYTITLTANQAKAPYTVEETELTNINPDEPVGV